jgi:hypothetical protein
MCERLEPRDEEEKPEVTRKRFDNELSVKRWRITPDHVDKYASAPVDDAAPWWWEGDAEASDSFLEAMGVNL